MGRLVAVLILLALIFGGIIWLVRWKFRQDERREDKQAGRAVHGDLNAKQEQMLIASNRAAAAIMRSLLLPPTSINDEIALIPQQSRLDMERWLHQFDSREVQR